MLREGERRLKDAAAAAAAADALAGDGAGRRRRRATRCSTASRWGSSSAQKTKMVQVDPADIGKIIGKGGETVRGLIADYGWRM